MMNETNEIKLNQKERAIYGFIADRIKRGEFAPSVRDIKEGLGIKSTSTVHNYLNKLEKNGYIQREAGKSRAIRIDNIGKNGEETLVRVPVLSKVTADIPVLAVENHEGYVDFPIHKKAYSNMQLFALRAKGNSMVEAGIIDGDYIIAEKTDNAENGDIIVVLVESEVMVRKYYTESGEEIRLQPCNSEARPLLVRETEAAVLGRVISVMRFY